MNAQSDLFGSGERTLLDDATGRITYTPSLVDAATAAAWFAELRDAVPWKSERRQMYDREVDVPRLLGSYRLDGRALPPAIATARDMVEAATHERYTGVGLNRYRDGNDSVAPHNDHLYELVPGHPIALLSLGAVRTMQIRSKERPRRALDVELEPGSLLVMSYATQIHYTHGVPKVAEPVGERISLAFRVKPLCK
ncbi:MAG TPA: alpha-ketoglutarate-dependent dioxygenase AlkB [Xanthomonadales bacterium]|nr:alpha-ketoglutarate-dependent dioxygenase AlkB [Xanthomonadales bacterium]